MVVQTEPQRLIEGLHDAQVRDVKLDGLDLVLQVSMPAAHATKQAVKGQRGLTPGDTELVFKQFRGAIPWALKGQTLSLLETKDGAYLIETDTFEDHVVWAAGLYLRLSPSLNGDSCVSAEGTRK